MKLYQKDLKKNLAESQRRKNLKQKDGEKSHRMGVITSCSLFAPNINQRVESSLEMAKRVNPESLCYWKARSVSEGPKMAGLHRTSLGQIVSTLSI